MVALADGGCQVGFDMFSGASVDGAEAFGEGALHFVLCLFDASVVLRVCAGAVERDDHVTVENSVNVGMVEVAAIIALDYQRRADQVEQRLEPGGDLWSVSKVADQARELAAAGQFLDGVDNLV